MNTPPASAARAPRSAWHALLVLTVVTFFAFVDRNVLLLLAEPVRRHFALSDLQLGLLQGSGVALFTALASYPLGWLADRYDRRWVLAGCIAFWSLAVAACGLADSFAGLFVASGMVAVGEAGLAPIAYALIPMLFVGAQRQAANSIFALTAVGGGALALALAGLLIEAAAPLAPLLPESIARLEPWRLSLLLAAVPAPLMILLVSTMRLPAPAATAPQHRLAGDAGAASLRAYAARHWRALLLFYGGVALAGMSFGAIGPWVAIGSARLFQESPAAVGAAMGAGQIVSAAAGFSLSLLVHRMFGRRQGARAPLLGLLAANGAMILCCLALPAIQSSWQLWTFYAIFGAFLSLGTMLHPTVLQSVIPTRFIGRAVAIQFIFTMVCAALPGPLVGVLSDRLSALPNGLLLAMAGVAATALALSALMFWRLLRRHYDATVSGAAAAAAPA